MLRRQYLAQAEEESKISEDLITEKRLTEIENGQNMTDKEKALFEQFIKDEYQVDEW